MVFVEGRVELEIQTQQVAAILLRVVVEVVVVVVILCTDLGGCIIKIVGTGTKQRKTH